MGLSFTKHTYALQSPAEVQSAVSGSSQSSAVGRVIAFDENQESKN